MDEDRKKAIETWLNSLSPGDRIDAEDALDNGHQVGWEFTEEAVVGKFTARVARERQQDAAQAVHEAVKHFEPFDELMENLKKEEPRIAGPATIRAMRNHYNAALLTRTH